MERLNTRFNGQTKYQVPFTHYIYIKSFSHILYILIKMILLAANGKIVKYGLMSQYHKTLPCKYTKKKILAQKRDDEVVLIYVFFVQLQLTYDDFGRVRQVHRLLVFYKFISSISFFILPKRFSFCNLKYQFVGRNTLLYIYF